MMMDDTPNTSNLQREINERMMKMRARTVEFPLERLIEDFRENRIVIDPSYREMFRWSVGRQSRLIESLLLEMPVPPVTTIELDTVSAAALVDGLNRLFAIVHFVDGHPDDQTRKLRLADCDIVPRLNGMVWSDLSNYLQSRMMNRPLRMDVLTKDCDPQLHYAIFKRLNSTIGSPSEHEIRECGIRLLGQSFLDYVASLSRLPEFVMSTMHLHGSKRVSGSFATPAWIWTTCWPPRNAKATPAWPTARAAMRSMPWSTRSARRAATCRSGSSDLARDSLVRQAWWNRTRPSGSSSWMTRRASVSS